MAPWLCNRFFGAALLIALIAMSALAIHAGMPLAVLLAIWGLLAINGAAANWIDYHAVLSGRKRPAFWGLALNGARFALLLGGIVALSLMAADSTTILTAALLGYFVFLTAQVAYLHTHSLRVSEAV